MKTRSWLAAATLLGSACHVAADDVSDSRHLLCTTLDAYVCLEDLGCNWYAPGELNVPRFLHVDARTRTLSTTEASGENRESVADSASRSGGQLVLQGTEAGRAYSLFIDEGTGEATFAAAAEGRSVTVFGACTPDD